MKCLFFANNNPEIVLPDNLDTFVIVINLNLLLLDLAPLC